LSAATMAFGATMSVSGMIDPVDGNLKRLWGR
jgi:hypothetical protein